MSNEANPYILFLILILLVLGFDPEATQKLEVMRNVVERMGSAVNNLKAGINSLNNDFEEIHAMMLGLGKPGGPV